MNTTASNMESKTVLFLLVALSVALGWILLPFYGTVMWAAIIAMLFSPMYRWLLSRLKQRQTFAALLTLLIVLLIAILPIAVISASLAREVTLIYERIQSGELNPALYFRGMFAALPDWATSMLDRFGLVDFDALQRRSSSALTQASQFLATQALSIGQNTFEFVASLFITLYLAFFLMRDGEIVVSAIKRSIPLSSRRKQALIEKFTTVIRATVKGNLLVAAIQGALGGLAFWFLGVTGALLWAVLMAFLSLLPAVGAGLVWLPVAIYLIITGSVWQGVALTAYGVLVIGLLDNVLRPLLVGKDTRMPDCVVMITTLGGMAVLGINGFIVGPVIAAMFLAVRHIHVSLKRWR